MGGCYSSCITRIPYATLIAFIMNVVGLITFTLTTHRGLSLTKEMLIETFKMNERWPDIVQVILVTVTGFMIMLGFMILFVGFLATGSTRRRVYRHLYSRIAGRISCAIFLGITYALVLFWMIVFAAIVVTTFIFVNFWFMCDNRSAASTKDIDLSQFRFYFPKDIREQTLIIPDHEIKQFCSDYVKYADVMFILATFGCLLVIISLIHYIICLSANYTHIRSQEKMYEMQELQYLTDPDMTTFSKDRF